MLNPPSWYITPTQFANLVVETMEELHYFKADELSHPEDIVITFQTVSEALAKGMGYAGRQVHTAERNKSLSEAMKDAMLTADFKKTTPTDNKSLINSYINKL